MENKKFNGFASEEQYLAVKNAVNECVGRDEIEVKYDKDTDTIGVDGWFYSFTIAGDMLTSIEMDDSDEFEDVMTIYESLSDIWKAYVDNLPKEYVATIEDSDFGDVDIFFYPSIKQIVANGLTISYVPSDWKVDDVMTAWECYKRHYGDYSAVGVLYERIADMESIYAKY